MYTLFYNLKTKPFAMNTDPSFAWIGEKQQEALARLRRGIVETTGFQLVTGAAGTGKTTLLQALTARLDRDIVWAVIDEPSMERIDFYNAIAGKFGVQESFTSKVQFLLQFRQFLHQAAGEKKKVLLLIDNCHLLPQEMLEDLRLLANIENAGVKLMQIFFFGQPECKDMLMQPKNRAVMQRLTHVAELLPLNVTETGDYIRHRLKIAGTEEPLFTAQAVQMVHRYAQGNPRRINALCDEALAAGAVQGVKSIDAKSIAACANQLTPGPVRRPSSFTGAGLTSHPSHSWARYGLGLLVLCLVGIAFWWPRGDSLQTVQQAPPETARTPQVVVPLGVPPVEVPKLQDVSPISPLPPVMTYKDDASATKPPEKSEVKPPEAAVATTPIGTEVADLPPGETAAAVVAAPAGEPQALAAPGAGQPEGTPETTAVAGAPLQQELTTMEPRMIRLPIHSNSLELTAAARNELDGFVEKLHDYPRAKLVVKGFVSAQENSPANTKLSEDRAMHVQKILLAKGIDAKRIEVVGMGNQEPIASNTTSAGRKKNRRVEVLVIHDGI
jgi:general secretion pathway protein A